MTMKFNELNKFEIIMLKTSFKLNVTAKDMLAMLINDEVNDFNVNQILNLIKFLLNSSF